jgi:hypothetical protein
MHLHKGLKLKKVVINNGRIKAYADDGTEIKITRAERHTLSNYNSSTYFDQIRKMFSHPDCIHSDFELIVDGNKIELED